jgi:hypothetical protein
MDKAQHVLSLTAAKQFTCQLIGPPSENPTRSLKSQVREAWYGKLGFVTHLTYNMVKTLETLRRRDLTTGIQMATNSVLSSSQNFHAEYSKYSNIFREITRISYTSNPKKGILYKLRNNFIPVQGNGLSFQQAISKPNNNVKRRYWLTCENTIKTIIRPCDQPSKILLLIN